MLRKSMRIQVSKSWIVVLLLVAAAGAYGFWPRRVDLREFNPAAVARLETAMWRDYYEKSYASLLRRLYMLNRDEYGFSPCDSARVAWYAATAARAFQPTSTRAEAEQAIPILESYFGVLRNRSHEIFDVHIAARLELDWWQLRREDTSAAQYGEAIARVTAEIFHVDNTETRESARIRAEMMDYRDERGDGRMQPADWTHIEEGLTRSYTLLHRALQSGR